MPIWRNAFETDTGLQLSGFGSVNGWTAADRDAAHAVDSDSERRAFGGAIDKLQMTPAVPQPAGWALVLMAMRGAAASGRQPVG